MLRWINIRLPDIDVLQWATKVILSLIENDAFRCLSPHSILFGSSVNSMISPPPSIQCCVGALWSVQPKNLKLQIVWGEETFPRRTKVEFYC